MPLKAKLDGKDFFAWDLEETNRKDKFGCPHCEDRLIPVMPEENIINHFRHKNNEAHGEPETPEHLAIKKTIYNTFGGDDSCSELEKRIGHHIVDVIAPLGHHGKMLAIECQCSSISVKEFNDRNTTYIENKDSYDYYPYWILGGNHFREKMRRSRSRRRKIERLIDEKQTLIYSDGVRIFRVRRDQFRSEPRGNVWSRFGNLHLTNYIISEIIPSRLVDIIHNDFGEEQ